MVVNTMLAGLSLPAGASILQASFEVVVHFALEASVLVLMSALTAGNYTETNQKVLTLPEDVGGSALELLLQGIYLQEVLHGWLPSVDVSE